MIDNQELLSTLLIIVVGGGLGAFGALFIILVIRCAWAELIDRNRDR